MVEKRTVSGGAMGAAARRRLVLPAVLLLLAAGTYQSGFAAEEVIELGGDRGWSRLTDMNHLVSTAGFRNFPTLELRDDAYTVGPDTEFLFHFDRTPVRDLAGRYAVASGQVEVTGELPRVGEGAAAFTLEGEGVELEARNPILFRRDTLWKAFSLEFWLYPANLNDGQTIIQWEGFRRRAGEPLFQLFRVTVQDRRLAWEFENLFHPPDGERYTVRLTARRGLVPRTWSHHMLRFDGSTGLLEYVVDGVPEAVTHVNAERSEGEGVFFPYIGASPEPKVSLGPTFVGLMDELRMERAFVEDPRLTPQAQRPGSFTTEILDLGTVASRVTEIEATYGEPGHSDVMFYYRTTEAIPELIRGDVEWKQFEPNRPFSDEPVGRFLQLRAELLPGAPEDGPPAVSRIRVRYEPNRPPSPPRRVIATPGDGRVTLEWSKVPEDDILGYKVYYGREPGHYFGTGSGRGPSPVDVGNVTEATLEGLSNGRLYYFAVAAYDASGITPKTVLSEEVRARPVRTPE